MDNNIQVTYSPNANKIFMYVMTPSGKQVTVSMDEEQSAQLRKMLFDSELDQLNHKEK